MTFFNATLIFGTLAAVIPVVLHLIARRQPRKVMFPSTRFLTRRLDSHRSRLRVRRWWLLALRIAAVVALALALARPTIDRSLSITWLTIAMIAAVGIALLVMASVAISQGGSKGISTTLASSAILALLAAMVWGAYTYATGPSPSLDTASPVAIAIVIDNSPTSAWKTLDDNRIETIQDAATWMVARLPVSSRIAVIDRSANPATFSLDVSDAIAKIEQVQPLQVAQPLASRIDSAARLIRTSEIENRQILILTDLTKSTWSEAFEGSSLSLSMNQSPPIALTIFDTGPFQGTNRSLSTPKLSDETPPKGTPVAISANLRLESYGGEVETDTTSVTVELQVFESNPALPVVRDGEVVYPKMISADRTSVSISASQTSEFLMTIPAMEVGSHHGLIRLVGDDPIAADDVRFFSAEVLPPSSVLLVSDDEDEARIMRQTISPTSINDENAEFIVQQISYADLPVSRLSEFQSVILLDPTSDILAGSIIPAYVESGGAVLVCLGPGAGDETISSQFTPDLVRRWRVPDDGTFFQVVASSHPVTVPVAKATPWSDFRIQQYWQVQPSATDSVLIHYAGTEHPALIDGRPDGSSSGRVLTLTTPIPALAKPMRDWNTLFGTDPWPAWLLVRQSVEELCGRGGHWMMSDVGQPRSIAVDPEKQTTLENGATRLQLFTPGGNMPIPLDLSADVKQVAIGEVPRAGVYWIRGDQPGRGFSANLSDDAMSFERVDQDRLNQIFGPESYSLATTLEEIELTESVAAGRVSLHSPVMLLALLVFLLEQVLGNRFYRRQF